MKNEKIYYTVELQVLMPVTLRYKSYAESPVKALDEVLKGKSKLINPPKHNFSMMKKIKAVVSVWGRNLIKYTKNF